MFERVLDLARSNLHIRHVEWPAVKWQVKEFCQFLTIFANFLNFSHIISSKAIT